MISRYNRILTNEIPDEEDEDSDEGDATASTDENDSFKSDAEESAQEPGVDEDEARDSPVDRMRSGVVCGGSGSDYIETRHWPATLTATKNGVGRGEYW